MPFYFWGMVRFDVDTCQARLDAFLDAEEAVLHSQSYSIGGRTMTRANLKEIEDGITLWAARLAEAKAVADGAENGIRMITPIVH